jgi:hypothetical protein
VRIGWHVTLSFGYWDVVERAARWHSFSASSSLSKYRNDQLSWCEPVITAEDVIAPRADP